MQTTRHIIWHLAVWLALAFSTLATCTPATANCSVAGHSAGTPHACCKTQPDTCTCACPSTHSGSNHDAHSGSCQLSDCPCALAPGRDSTPAPPRATQLFYPVVVTTGLTLVPAETMQRPTSARADVTSQSTLLPSSSSRAPPFQG